MTDDREYETFWLMADPQQGNDKMFREYHTEVLPRQKIIFPQARTKPGDRL
jgi:hypothetical protein